MPEHTRPAEHDLLVEALELPVDAHVTMTSREPLGDGSVAGFDVTAPGEAPLLYFVDTSRRRVAEETGLSILDGDVTEARVWVHPADPHLPALAPVAFSHAAEALLRRLSLDPVGSPEFIAYRPGRRGVVRVPTTTGIAWIKVVPPSRLDRIVTTHRVLAERGIPLPALLGWSETGLLVLADAAGTPASEAPWHPETLLDDVDALRRAFAEAPLAHRARSVFGARLEWYATRLRALPGPHGAIVDEVTDAAASAPRIDHPVVVHGDLHFGQLFLDDQARVSAVIDVDTAGIGHPDEDAAAFLSHAIASALMTDATRDERVWALVHGAAGRWDNGPGLRVGTATHLLGHALSACELGDRDRGDSLFECAHLVITGRADQLARF
jgi:hypothetical protein